ncbi:2088_t:CDS:1, partial [Dentiscutata erythropus]
EKSFFKHVTPLNARTTIFTYIIGSVPMNRTETELWSSSGSGS